MLFYSAGLCCQCGKGDSSIFETHLLPPTPGEVHPPPEMLHKSKLSYVQCEINGSRAFPGRVTPGERELSVSQAPPLLGAGGGNGHTNLSVVS